ncbi:Gamma-glutamyl phosphate reductase (GPR) (Glutamate-5-semialdehyde dehydrogenase) (Glutamyl-gamma-semialdehyde dehydrogenase) (GSA dehydrogenase) (fragment) [Bradyrhizobium sp. STM 3843]
MTYTVEALREEAQAVDLFDLPAGLRKFDPAALLERVRLSDVWVEAH